MENKVRFVDTTLRDGAQSPGVAFTDTEQIDIVRALDNCGIDIIEVGIPAMGLGEQNSILKMKEYFANSKLLVWNRIVASDIEASIMCLPDIIHISLPVSERQISYKLHKNYSQVKKALQECAYKAKCLGYPISIGFEDASRANEIFLAELLETLCEFEPLQIRYADTVGILTPMRTYKNVESLKNLCPFAIEFHGHNDLGFALANTVAAIQAGATIVDTTLLGIGERSGNCDFVKLVQVLQKMNGTSITFKEALIAQNILKKYVSDEWGSLL